MRKFYIFNINKEFRILNENNEYDLYRQMESIKRLSKDKYYIGVKLFNTLASTINANDINNKIYEKNKKSDFYTKYRNIHMINNYYKDEESKLIINKVYMLLESNKVKSSFFKDLKDKGLFVCDFENKDYFWLDKLYNS